MERPIRVGVVGANAHRAWAHDAHIPALKRLPQFELGAVSARTQDLAEEARAAFGAARGDSLALVRDPDIDRVSVTVKVPEHRALVLAALEAGKHVYCEWPLGRDVAEAEEMARAVRPVSHVAIGFQALSHGGSPGDPARPGWGAWPAQDIAGVLADRRLGRRGAGVLRLPPGPPERGDAGNHRRRPHPGADGGRRRPLSRGPGPQQHPASA